MKNRMHSYCEGIISNGYNQGAVAVTTGSYNAGGVVGILTGAAGFPVASMSDCYNTGLVSNQSSGNTEALWGYSDNSSAVTVSNCVYVDTNTQDTLGATTSNVTSVTDAEMRSPQVISATALNIIYFMQSGSDYPVLNWQQNIVASGAQSDFVAALARLTATNSTVTITGTEVTLDSGTTTIDIAGVGGSVVRASGYIGELLDIHSGAALVINSGTIGSDATAPGIRVDGGTLTLTPTAALSIVEIVYLSTDTDVINIGDTIAAVSVPILIQSGDLYDDIVVAQGSGGYTLVAGDATACQSVDSNYAVVLSGNTLILEPVSL
jgi:hypothetical protein